MKTCIIGLSCLFCFCSLMAQGKKSFDGVEYKRLCNVVSSDSIVLIWDNSDTLRLNKEIYSILRSPVDVITGSSDILYNRPPGFAPGLSFRKRYIVDFEIQKDILYITDIQIARDYNPQRSQNINISKDIEKLLGKKRKKGKIEVDWMAVEGYTNCITLYVMDSSSKVYSLDFEEGKFIRKTLRRGIRTEKFSLPKLEDLKEQKK